LQIAALLWIVALLLIQRPNAWTKVWVFLQPLMLLWAAAGIFGLVQKIRFGPSRRLSLSMAAFGVILAAGIWQAIRLAPQLPELWAEKGQEETAVLFIRDQMQEDDWVVVAPTLDAPVWYYSELHGIPDGYFNSRSSDFQRLIVLVNPAEGQTLDSVISQRGPALQDLDSGSAHLMGTFGSLQVFEVQRK